MIAEPTLPPGYEHYDQIGQCLQLVNFACNLRQ